MIPEPQQIARSFVKLPFSTVVAAALICGVLSPVTVTAQGRPAIEISPLLPGQPTPLTVNRPQTVPAPQGTAPRAIVPEGRPERDLLRGSTPSLALDSQGRTVLTPEYCAAQVAAEATADVAFRPGVDVVGRPVAPADLPGGAQGVGLPVGTNILLDSGRRGLLPGQRLETHVGTVVVEPSGRVLLNGQPLGTEPPRSIAALCSELARPTSPR
jgi:hypothetical protein